MITTILLFILVVSTGIYVFRNRDFYYPFIVGSRDRSLNFPKIIKTGVIFFGLFILFLIQPYKLERVDSSGIGLKVNLTGSNRGIDNYRYATGWVAVNGWTEVFKEFPTFQQHLVYDSLQVIMKGGFPTFISPAFNYSLRKENIGDMFMNLRLDVKDIEQGWLKTAILSAVNDVANTWEVDSIFNYREQFEVDVFKECNERVGKWMLVSQLRTNIIPPEALQEAIIAKTQAIQNAEAAEQEAKTEFSRALKKMAIARGDSAEVVIKASGEAKAIQLRQQQLTPAYIEYIKWKNAGDDVPRVPSTVLGSSNGIIIGR